MLVSDTGCCAQKTMKRSSAFNAKLVEELVKNADSLDHVTLMDADGTDPLSGHYTSNYTREYCSISPLGTIWAPMGLKIYRNFAQDTTKARKRPGPFKGVRPFLHTREEKQAQR